MKEKEKGKLSPSSRGNVSERKSTKQAIPVPLSIMKKIAAHGFVVVGGVCHCYGVEAEVLFRLGI